MWQSARSLRVVSYGVVGTVLSGIAIDKGQLVCSRTAHDVAVCSSFWRGLTLVVVGGEVVVADGVALLQFRVGRAYSHGGIAVFYHHGSSL